MNPAIIQAIAGQRTATMREEAAAWRRRGTIRRSRAARLLRTQGAGRRRAPAPAPRSLHDPGAA